MFIYHQQTATTYFGEAIHENDTWKYHGKGRLIGKFGQKNLQYSYEGQFSHGVRSGKGLEQRANVIY